MILKHALATFLLLAVPFAAGAAPTGKPASAVTPVQAAMAPAVTPSPSPSPSSSPSSSPPSAAAAVAPSPTPAAALLDEGDGFLNRYPHLKQNLYQEPNSNLYLGFGAGVLGVLHDRFLFSANFFQIHYMVDNWDAEVLSISYGTTTANPSYVQSNHFIFRTIPKYRITPMISVGPLLGWEYVSFPKISAEQYDGLYATKPEPFSSSGMIYGVGVSENVKWNDKYKLKVNELLYEQTYSTHNAGHGWSYLYDSQALRLDPTPIQAGPVFLIEVGLIY